MSVRLLIKLRNNYYKVRVLIGYHTSMLSLSIIDKVVCYLSSYRLLLSLTHQYKELIETLLYHARR